MKHAEHSPIPEPAANELWLHINVPMQTLSLTRGRDCITEFPVATARNGVGERNGSECTPRGWHRIRARIGAGLADNSVLVGRRPTGELYTPQLRKQFPGRDWILTRILWLCGEEVGRNRLGNVDTMRRYIYIHGSPPEDPMGVPSSHGCIKMRNADVRSLFDQVTAGTRVLIDD